ncbi:kinase-like protein [Trametes versicolor FP-101664 SS1]|uniref:kinase-like protein n=1 Tax=Trametes versicolor (strain FP-101664) TaxID=717944 RepID=UPI00046228EF|nr:kinase-like protein [Trametes versicolor FP-101664 SS1]EIW60025.1 kinase-like protein [Trametes versicolor FP-101664 SS1]
MSSNGIPTASPSTQASDQLPTQPGQTLNNGRYEVHRKLGSGIYSTTWLVSDTRSDEIGATSKYYAAKILTIEGSREHIDGSSRELEFLQQIAACEDVNSLPVLHDHFEESGPLGTHLCFIMNLLNSDVSTFRRSSPTKSLPAYTVKKILTHTLEGLIQLHELNIIHTDLKLDNILFSRVGSDKDVDSELKSNPAIADSELEMEGKNYPLFRSQPLPHGHAWDASPSQAEAMQFTIIDLGQAQRAGEQPTVDEFSAYSLRAPELILRSDFGPKIDIWALGCLTFEMLTGRWLFAPEEGGDDWSLEDDHLAKMLELTGERFSPAMLERAQLRSKYLDAQGNLLRLELIPGQSIEAALAVYKTMPTSEVAGAASFIRACLKFEPSDRASAKELKLHPWLTGSSCAQRAIDATSG